MVKDMQEKDIKLLFDADALRTCVVVPALLGSGYMAMFCKQGDIKPVIVLETRPRKSGDVTEHRVFKTIDSACSLVKRKIGFKSFDVEL